MRKRRKAERKSPKIKAKRKHLKKKNKSLKSSLPDESLTLNGAITTQLQNDLEAMYSVPITIIPNVTLSNGITFELSVSYDEKVQVPTTSIVEGTKLVPRTIEEDRPAIEPIESNEEKK